MTAALRLKPKNRAASLLAHAREHRYAIGAFNAVNMETAEAIVQAAELEKAPVILQVSENAARYAGLEHLTAVCQSLREHASIPVILHFDHAETLESALTAVALGYDMVMLEGGDLDLDGNARRLKLLSKTAHALGVAVEGEFEVTLKGDRDATHLSASLLADFMKVSGVDAVAVDIGTSHKQTEKTAKLDLHHLRDLARHTAAPLVLHGSSGATPEDLRLAIFEGISKVNVATELMLEFTRGVREQLSDPQLYDARKYLGYAREVMTERVRTLIQNFGSSGQVL